MSKKEKFINEVIAAIDGLEEKTPENYFSEDALLYFNALKTGEGTKESKSFTENGKLILKYIQENKDTYNNLFKAKDIGEGLGISSRTASGAMRKLVNDGYIEKMGENPVVYSLTEKGKDINLDEV